MGSTIAVSSSTLHRAVSHAPQVALRPDDNPNQTNVKIWWENSYTHTESGNGSCYQVSKAFV